MKFAPVWSKMLTSLADNGTIGYPKYETYLDINHPANFRKHRHEHLILYKGTMASSLKTTNFIISDEIDLLLAEK